MNVKRLSIRHQKLITERILQIAVFSTAANILKQVCKKSDNNRNINLLRVRKEKTKSKNYH